MSANRNARPKKNSSAYRNRNGPKNTCNDNTLQIAQQRSPEKSVLTIPGTRLPVSDGLFSTAFRPKSQSALRQNNSASGTKLAAMILPIRLFQRRLPMNRLVYALGVMAVAALTSFPAFAQDSPSSKVTGVIQNGNKTIVFENNSAGLNLDQISAFSQVKASDPA